MRGKEILSSMPKIYTQILNGPTKISKIIEKMCIKIIYIEILVGYNLYDNTPYKRIFSSYLVTLIVSEGQQ